MRITWKDGITTLTTAAAVLLERAYFHSWDIPLVSNMSWVIVGIAVLIAIGFSVSYLLDESKGEIWTWAAGLLAASAVVLSGLGLYYRNSDYVVLLMFNAVVFWIASLIDHVTIPDQASHSHA